MTIVRYYRDERPSDVERIKRPSWDAVEQAIRQMENYCYPIVQLTCTADPSSEGFEDDSFNIIGGNGRWALFHIMNEWQYVDPSGSAAEARLWESDQGYYCEERNILTEIEKVLRITRAFYDTGSYDGLYKVT